MSMDSPFSLFLSLGVFLLYLLVNRASKKKVPEHSCKKVVVRSLSKSASKKESKVVEELPCFYQNSQPDPSYQVEKKSAASPLQKGWRRPSSLRQAILLAEVLKRKDL